MHTHVWYYTVALAHCIRNAKSGRVNISRRQRACHLRKDCVWARRISLAERTTYLHPLPCWSCWLVGFLFCTADDERSMVLIDTEIGEFTDGISCWSPIARPRWRRNSFCHVHVEKVCSEYAQKHHKHTHISTFSRHSSCHRSNFCVCNKWSVWDCLFLFYHQQRKTFFQAFFILLLKAFISIFRNLILFSKEHKGGNLRRAFTAVSMK